jgi:hypothetical protein
VFVFTEFDNKYGTPIGRYKWIGSASSDEELDALSV